MIIKLPWLRSKSDRLSHIFRVKLNVKRTFLASWLKERGIRTCHFFCSWRLTDSWKGQKVNYCATIWLLSGTIWPWHRVTSLLTWRLVVKSKLGSLSLLALTTKLQSHFLCSAVVLCVNKAIFLYFIGSKDSKFLNDRSAIERCADPGNKFAWY